MIFVWGLCIIVAQGTAKLPELRGRFETQKKIWDSNLGRTSVVPIGPSSRIFFQTSNFDIWQFCTLLAVKDAYLKTWSVHPILWFWCLLVELFGRRQTVNNICRLLWCKFHTFFSQLDIAFSSRFNNGSFILLLTVYIWRRIRTKNKVKSESKKRDKFKNWPLVKQG